MPGNEGIVKEPFILQPEFWCVDVKVLDLALPFTTPFWGPFKFTFDFSTSNGFWSAGADQKLSLVKERRDLEHQVHYLAKVGSKAMDSYNAESLKEVHFQEQAKLQVNMVQTLQNLARVDKRFNVSKNHQKRDTFVIFFKKIVHIIKNYNVKESHWRESLFSMRHISSMTNKSHQIKEQKLTEAISTPSAFPYPEKSSHQLPVPPYPGRNRIHTRTTN